MSADWTTEEFDDARDDVWSILDHAVKEVPGLLLALQEGRIDGSQYSGECRCLIGTTANLRGTGYAEMPGIKATWTELSWHGMRPAEHWCLKIEAGDTPDNNEYAAAVEDWILEWLAIGGGAKR
jgi:hypothetical protein